MPARAASRDMKAIVDRIEDGVAVLEADERQLTLKAAMLPDAKEGDVLDIVLAEDGSVASYSIDRRETARRAKLAKKRLKGLFGRKR